jgi:hypothetical protein
MSSTQAAARLNASAVTVRTLLETGELSGERRPRGGRFVWAIDPATVESFLARHGRFDGTRRRTRVVTVARLERELGSLRSAGRITPAEIARLRDERDNLRAHSVALGEALAQTRAVADLDARADAERAAVIEHLLDAAGAAERADALRRDSIAALHEAVGAFTRAGHAGELRAEGDSG